MHRKRFIQAAAMAFGLIGSSVFAAQNFSGLSTAQLMQMKPREMSAEDRGAFRDEIRKRLVSMSPEEKELFRNKMRGQGQGMQGKGGLL